MRVLKGAPRDVGRQHPGRLVHVTDDGCKTGAQDGGNACGKCKSGYQASRIAPEVERFQGELQSQSCIGNGYGAWSRAIGAFMQNGESCFKLARERSEIRVPVRPVDTREVRKQILPTGHIGYEKGDSRHSDRGCDIAGTSAMIRRRGLGFTRLPK